MTANTLRYAGFWPRLGSLLVDILVFVPLGLVMTWIRHDDRLFDVYWLIPNALISLFLGVWLVRRFGGTPGKLAVGIRIRKVDGSPVGYREATLRYLPDFSLCLLTSIALVMPLLHMTDAEYSTLSSTHELSKRVIESVPAWYNPLTIVQGVWAWGELIVLLTNHKRRALHDFIAGTVVVCASSIPKVKTTADESDLLTAHDF